MPSFPDIHDYPAIVESIKLREQLITEKDPETIKYICKALIDMIPDVKTQQKEYNAKYKMAFPSATVYDFVTVEPFKRLAIMYEKEGNLQYAMLFCDYALSLGYNDDGTKGGMKGRLDKLRKKAGY